MPGLRVELQSCYASRWLPHFQLENQFDEAILCQYCSHVATPPLNPLFCHELLGNPSHNISQSLRIPSQHAAMAAFLRALGPRSHHVGDQRLHSTVRCPAGRVESEVTGRLGTTKASDGPTMPMATTIGDRSSGPKCFQEFGGRSEVQGHPSIHPAFGETNPE